VRTRRLWLHGSGSRQLPSHACTVKGTASAEHDLRVHSPRAGAAAGCRGRVRSGALKVISQRSATRLQEAKELRDDLAHAYPPAGWKALRESVQILLAELDRYVDRCATWMAEEGILEMEAEP
jgi:hypothetical protein